MRIAVQLTVLLALLSTCLPAEENDWLIVPGKRVGSIQPSFTRSDIIRVFGPKNAEENEIAGTDMGTEIGTRVFWSQPDAALAIYWVSDAADSKIRRIRVCPGLVLPARCKWHTAEGISLGTSLKDLERLNGRPFQLNGFDWGFGGLVTSWSGGHLEKLAGNCGGLIIRTDPPPGPASDARAQLLDALDGDDEFPSSNSAMQLLNPVVDFLSVSFQGCK